MLLKAGRVLASFGEKASVPEPLFEDDVEKKNF